MHEDRGAASEPDLDALADRLSAAADRSGEPVPSYRTPRPRKRWMVTTALAGALLPTAALLTLRANAFALGYAVLFVLVGLLGGLLSGRTTVHVDDRAVEVRGSRVRRANRRFEWRELLEVGCLDMPQGQVMLALRPRGGRWEHPGELSPLTVPVPVRGATLREFRDVLEHGCRRHQVPFTEHDGAIDSAPPGSRLRD